VNVARSRAAVGITFLVHGAVAGSFAARIPWIRDHLGLTPGQLGLALLLPAIGALLTMPVAGALVHRYDGDRVTRILIGAWCAVLALPALAPSFPVFCLVLAFTGAVGGMADVAMNTQAVAVEAAAGKSIMSSLHGMWSVGGFLGSGIGVLAAHAGVDARVNLAVMAGVLFVVGQVAGRGLPHSPPSEDEDVPHFVRPSRPVLLIGLLGFCSVFAEGAAGDWCAVYLRDVVDSSDATAAAAYSAFAGAMASARLAGDGIVRRLGAVDAVRLSGAVGLAGAALVVAARAPVPAIAGFALIGLGVSVVVPLAFAAGGRAVPHAGHGIAGVATIAYGAGLAAPGIIGAIADVASLPAAFVVVAGFLALTAAGAPVLRVADRAVARV
jgi:predicted MFS family arabinose efflux permease